MKILVLSLFLGLGSVALAAPGPLSHAEIKSVVDHHIDDVKGCMKAHGAATGKLVVKFAIQPDGKAVDAAPDHASSNPKLDRCIAAAFGHWRFPKPHGGVTMGVVYPFYFTQPATLEKDQVVGAIRPHQPDIKACYDAALKTIPDVAGEVDVAISVAPSGKVAGATVHSSTTKAPTLDSCITGKIKGWIFPKPKGTGNYDFTFPFVLGTPKAPAPAKS